MTHWNRDLFLHSYDWSRPPNNWAYLGNGDMSAFFDGTAINTCDYAVAKGIRRSANLAGLFWTYSQPPLHRHVYQRVTLDMYGGLLHADEPCSHRQAWRRVTTFFHLTQKLLVFHLDQHQAENDPKTVGLSLRSRGGYPVRRGPVTRRETNQTVALDFPVSADAQPDLRYPEALPNPAFRELAFNASIALGLEGDGRLLDADDGNIEVAIPRTGVTSIYIAFDASRGGQPDAESIVQEALQKGYDQTLREHSAAWEEFWANSGMDLPHEHLTRVYVASLYYLRVSAGGYSIPPFLPAINAWGSSYNGWDDTHIHHGLLTSNQVAVAGGMVDHWASLSELGREAMRKRGGHGILLEFGLEPEYYSTASEPRSRDDFNAAIGAGLSAWRHYTHTGDRGSLEKHYELIKGTAEMLATYAFVPHGDRLWLRKARQVDDHFGEEGRENAFGPAVMGKALLADAAVAYEQMGDETAALRFREASERIELPEKDGMYVTFAGCPPREISDESILCFFPAMIIPDRQVAERTLDWYERTCMSTQGLQNRPSWAENRAVFPWVHFRAMIGELMLGRRERFERLLEQALANDCYVSDYCLMSHYVGRFGGWHDTPGMLTGAGALLQVVNLMLLDGDAQSIRVFPGVPEGWLEQRIAFQLRTAPGVRVSLTSIPGQAVSMEFESAKPVTVHVRKPSVAVGALLERTELEVQDGYVRFQIPAGPSRVQIAWKLR